MKLFIHLYLKISYTKIYTEKVLHNDTKESESFKNNRRKSVYVALKI